MNAPIVSWSPGPLAESPACRISLAEPVARFSLRARADLAPLDKALGVTLPRRIGMRAEAKGIHVLCLGPDEWVLHLMETGKAKLEATCDKIYSALPHSLVDISGREVTFVIDGPRAVDMMTLGCPRDIDTIRVGAGRRTVFDGISVVLWRDGDTEFRMDCWHSFAPHVLHLLQTGCRELAAEKILW